MRECTRYYKAWAAHGLENAWASLKDFTGKMHHLGRPSVWRLACSGGMAVTVVFLPACRNATPSEAPPARSAPEVRVPVAPAAPASPVQQERAPSSCSGSEGEFRAAWPKLQLQLQSGVAGLEALLAPQHGVFVIDNPGAFTVPMHFVSHSAAAEQVPRLRAKHYRFSCPELTTGERPKFSCESERWSEQGCLHTSNPDFSVVRWYERALQYEVLPQAVVSEALDRARQADARIQHGVYSTDEALGLYFGLVDCKWRVLAVDTVTPCSA